MATHRFVHPFRLSYFLISIIVFISSSCTYQGNDYIFKAPFGFKTKQFQTAVNQNIEPGLLIFSQKGRLYFEIFRNNIPEGSNLDTEFNTYKDQQKSPSHYQFISQKSTEINQSPAIEYIFREFRGEPYVQVREIWIEHNGWAYSLKCTNPADSTTGKEIPVSELCYQLVDNVQFK